jgi:hypothetical protein
MSSPADFFLSYCGLFYSFQSQVIFNKTKESFKPVMLLLICECIKFLPNIKLLTISTKVLLKILQVILGLETTCLLSCKCILLVKILFGEPHSQFTNFHSAFAVWLVGWFPMTGYSFTSSIL